MKKGLLEVLDAQLEKNFIICHSTEQLAIEYFGNLENINTETVLYYLADSLNINIHINTPESQTSYYSARAAINISINENEEEYYCETQFPALIEAILNQNNLEYTRGIIRNNPNSAYEAAILNNNLAYIQEIIDNHPNSIFEMDMFGNTALHLAAANMQDNAEVVRLLLEHGANAGVINNAGHNALHIAIIHQNTEITAEIANSNTVNLSDMNNHGHTPLQLASGNAVITDILSSFIGMNSNQNETNDISAYLSQNLIARSTTLVNSSNNLINMDNYINTPAYILNSTDNFVALEYYGDFSDTSSFL